MLDSCFAANDGECFSGSVHGLCMSCVFCFVPSLRLQLAGIGNAGNSAAWPADGLGRPEDGPMAGPLPFTPQMAHGVQLFAALCDVRVQSLGQTSCL